MKVILFINNSFILYMVTLVNALSKYIEVILVCPDNYFNKKILNLVDKSITIEYFRASNRHISAENIRVLYFLYRCLHKHNPDVVHIQAHGSDWFLFLWPFIKKFPIVNTVHDSQRHMGEERLRSIIRIFFGVKLSDILIVHGNFVKSDIIKKYRINENRIQHTPISNYECLNLLNTSNETNEKFHVLFFGRIKKYKGLENLIKAETRLSTLIPDLKILIAGKGNMADYKQKIQSKGTLVIRNEYIGHTELPNLFKNCDVVVLPYLEASQTGIIPLAYKYGKPVIVTDVGSLSEIVVDGHTGYVVPSGDSEILAERISHLLSDNNLMERMSKNCLQYYKREFSSELIAKTTIKAYIKSILFNARN